MITASSGTFPYVWLAGSETPTYRPRHSVLYGCLQYTAICVIIPSAGLTYCRGVLPIMHLAIYESDIFEVKHAAKLSTFM